MALLNFMRKVSPYAIVGLAGVAKEESTRARFWSKIFSYSLWLAAVLLLYQWHFQQLGMFSLSQLRWMNWAIWGYFVLSFALIISMVRAKWHYIAENWMLTVVILLGIPTLFVSNPIAHNIAGLRPFLALYLFIPSVSLLWHFFKDGKLRTTLMAAMIIVFVFGILVSSIDPNVHSVFDGIWWAVATISTVGYGDVVPSSHLGRMIGVVLIVLGIGVFVTITANFLALILRKDDDQLTVVLKELKKLNSLLEDNDLLKKPDGPADEPQHKHGVEESQTKTEAKRHSEGDSKK